MLREPLLFWPSRCIHRGRKTVRERAAKGKEKGRKSLCVYTASDCDVR